MEDKPTPQPWERQKGESAKAFEAFCVYRNMAANRSLQKTCDELEKSMDLISGWSSKWDWVARVLAFDEHMERVRLKAQEEAIFSMAKRQADSAVEMMDMLMAPVRWLAERMQDPEFLESIKRMGPEELVTYIQRNAKVLPEISKMERLARGEVTERVEQKGSLEVQGKVSLSERIEQYLGAAEQALGGQGPSDPPSDGSG